MLLKKIIFTLILTGLSVPHLILAQDFTPVDQSFSLVYSERTDIGGDLEQIIANMEELAMKDAEQKCNGAAKKLKETQSFYHGPRAYTLMTLTFEFSCASAISVP
jgi:hypothetical protein